MTLDKEEVVRLDGALRYLSRATGNHGEYCFYLDMYYIDSSEPAAFQKKFLKCIERRYGREFGREYHFQYMKTVNPSYFCKYVYTAFKERTRNAWDVAFALCDAFYLLYDWEMPKEIQVCDIRRRKPNQQGQVFFIPAGKNRYLISTWLCTNGLLD